MDELEKIEVELDTFLSDYFALPPLPEAVLKIQGVVSSGYAGVEVICEILLRDPVLTAQVLKIVNSAYYGFTREIDDIKFAVAYLGIHEINNIVISTSVVNTLGVKDTKVLENFWSHSILTALCAKFLTKKFEPLLSQERVWLGAVLHDIGKLVYYRFFPKHYEALVEFSHRNGCLFSDAEKHFSLPPSSLFGRVLCERWRLPQGVRAACEQHTLDDLVALHGKGTVDFVKIICSANLMAVIAKEDLKKELKQKIFDILAKNYNCSEIDFLKLMGDIYELKIEVDNYRW